jgi:DNA-directed RNA polymerase subunit N
MPTRPYGIMPRDHSFLEVQSKLAKTFINSPKSLKSMIIPIRCWSCGKPIAHLWENYKERIAKGEERKKVLDELGIERYCCRAMFLGQVDLIDTAAQFKRF